MPQHFMSSPGWKVRSILAFNGVMSALVAHGFMLRGYSLTTDLFATHEFKSLLVIALLFLGITALRWLCARSLRSREFETIELRARSSFMDSVFAATLYRQEMTGVFATFVTLLLVAKFLHVYAQNRMDTLEEQPLLPRIQHVRHVLLILGLFVLDAQLVLESIQFYYESRTKTMLGIFAFEFVVRLIDLASLLARYILHAVDLHCEGRWDAKGSCTYYNELIADSTTLLVYLGCFAYLSNFHTFPLYIVIEFSTTFARFRRCLANFLRYRRIVRMMDKIFPDASQQELKTENNTCSICRDEMLEAKKLECGHMFHKSCLQSWLKLQLVCPVCRVQVNVLGEADAAFRGARGGYEFGFTREQILMAELRLINEGT